MFDNPIAIFEKMGEIHEAQRLNSEIVRSQGRGCKRAAIEMRRATYDIGLLGKQFRDLSTLDDKISKAEGDEVAKLQKERQDMVEAFAAKWAKRRPGK